VPLTDREDYKALVRGVCAAPADDAQRVVFGLLGGFVHRRPGGEYVVHDAAHVRRRVGVGPQRGGEPQPAPRHADDLAEAEPAGDQAGQTPPVGVGQAVAVDPPRQRPAAMARERLVDEHYPTPNASGHGEWRIAALALWPAQKLSH
jgi:hypothetical protein